MNSTKNRGMSTRLAFSIPAVTPSISTRQTITTTAVCHRGLPSWEAAAEKNWAGSAVISAPDRDPARLLSTQPRITA